MSKNRYTGFSGYPASSILVRLVRGVQIFEPLGGDFGGLFLYLGFLGLNLKIWSKNNMGNKQKRKKK